MLRLSASLLAAAAAVVAVPLGAGATGYTPGVMVTCDTPNPAGAEVPATAVTLDQVTGEGATTCEAFDIANPAAAITLSGSIHLDLSVEEQDPSSGAVHWVVDASTRAPMTVAGDAIAGALAALVQGVPAAGQTDPTTGWTSLGSGEFYVGAAVSADGMAEPTGPGCLAGDYSCGLSAAFPLL